MTTTTSAIRVTLSRPRPKNADIWRLADGRVLADLGDGEQLYPDIHAVVAKNPKWVPRYHRDERRDVEAPPLPAKYHVSVDWAEIHAAATRIDVAREGSNIGYDDNCDAFGGTYTCTDYDRGLVSLVTLVQSVHWIAKDAWQVVHRAARDEDGIAKARRACRVAIACSHLYALLHRAGVIGDPRERICGTGEGYGLTGLHWLAGRTEDGGANSDEVRRFVETGELPRAVS